MNKILSEQNNKSVPYPIRKIMPRSVLMCQNSLPRFQIAKFKYTLVGYPIIVPKNEGGR